MNRFARRLFHLCRWAGIALAAAGWIARLSVKDTAAWAAPFFYATPWPVLAALPLPDLLWRLRQRRWPVAAALCAASLAAAGCWWMLARFTPPIALASPPDAIRFVHWTADNFKPGRGVAGGAAFLHSFRPDAVSLVEGNVDIGGQQRVFGSLFAGYDMRLLGGGTAFLCAGKIVSAEDHSLAGGWAHLSIVRAEIRGQPLTFCLFDHSSNPLKHRRAGLEELAAHLDALIAGGEVVVLSGDFNTPADSALLDPIRQRLTRAFAACGDGFHETFPDLAPVLAIDHIWLGKSIRPLRCRRESPETGIGHRALLCDFVVR